MKYGQFEGIEIQTDTRIEFKLPYSTEAVIKRIRDLKKHGYTIVEEDVKPSRVKAESMSSETVEGPLEGDFHLKTPGEVEYILGVKPLLGTKLTVEMDDNAQFSEFMSMFELIAGPKPGKRRK